MSTVKATSVENLAYQFLSVESALQGSVDREPGRILTHPFTHSVKGEDKPEPGGASSLSQGKF